MSAVPADAVPACSIAGAMMRVDHWYRVTRGGVNLGFHHRTMLGKVIEEGAQGASHEHVTQVAPWLSPADEEIDRIIARMPVELRDSLVLDQQRDLPMKAMAAKLGADPSEVRRWVAASYGWVAAMVTASSSAAPGRLMR